MRGKANDIFNAIHRHGITPAYAGKSFSLSFANSMYQDHPRLCGEKRMIFLTRYTVIGSPPPMRGKVSLEHTALFEGRITPAYAGKSLDSWDMDLLREDHPRLCGEKLSQYAVSSAMTGSPPPMRGKVLSITPDGLNSGITPAYAGKSVKNY